MPVTPSYGTLQVSDLLAVNNTSIIDYGAADVYSAVRLGLDAYNDLIDDELAVFVDTTTERTIGTGGPQTMAALFTDEYAVPDSQKVGAPAIMGFPLRQWDVSVQWTLHYLASHTPAELAAQFEAAMLGDLQKLHASLRTAFYRPTNYNFTDRLVDNMTIPVKALANADGFPIPAGPNGVNFTAGSHTHFMGSAGASLVGSDVDALLSNVTEHHNGGAYRLFVSQDVATTIEAGRYSTPNNFPLFSPLLYMGTNTPDNAIYATGTKANVATTNRKIGMYREAEVWVKPWMPSATLIALNITGGRKPLARRIPKSVAAGSGNFGIIFEDQSIPIQCRIMRRQTGFGVQNRVSAAVMTVGSPTYSMPSVN